jgi:hypothetical protein
MIAIAIATIMVVALNLSSRLPEAGGPAEARKPGVGSGSP